MFLFQFEIHQYCNGDDSQEYDKYFNCSWRIIYVSKTSESESLDCYVFNGKCGNTKKMILLLLFFFSFSLLCPLYCFHVQIFCLLVLKVLIMLCRLSLLSVVALQISHLTQKGMHGRL